jgi:hypothetical protein
MGGSRGDDTEQRVQYPSSVPPPGAAEPSPGPAERLLFALLILLHLLPLWLSPSFPSQDGPSHQGVAAILRHLNGPEGAPLRPLFVEHRGALPNGFVFWLLAKVFGFASVALAEKLLLALYVVLLPLSLRYAVASIEPRAVFLSWLAFPFVYNFLLHMGFYNFCYSLAAFLFTIGFAWRMRERSALARTAGLALLVTWVYFCHPVTLVVTVATLGALAGWGLVLEQRGKARWSAGLGPAAARRLLLPLLAALPALLLIGSFVTARRGARVDWLPLGVRLKHLAGLYSLASLDRRTAWLAAGCALLILALAALFLSRRWRPDGDRHGVAALTEHDGFLAALAVVLAAYFLAPSQMSGGAFIVHRLNLFPYLILILWLAASPHPRRRRIAIQAAAAGLALGFLALHGWTYRRLAPGLAEIEAAGRAVEPGRTLLFLSYAHQGDDGGGRPQAFRTQPFVHAGSAVAAARGAVDLALYEANEDYFPIAYRPERNPYTHLSTAPLGIETEPPQVDLAGYTRRTGEPIDYVLLWGWRDARLSEPAVAAVRRQLDTACREIERSLSGRVRLYRCAFPGSAVAVRE